MGSFISRIGGKHLLRRDIVGLMPPDRQTYVEVFGGAGHVMFAKPTLSREVEVFNDIDKELVNLFRVVRNRCDEFERRQYFLLSSRTEYQAFLADYRARTPKDEIDRAIMYYYLVMNSFGSGVTTGFGTGKAKKPRYPACIENLGPVRERLKRVTIECLSFDKLIPKYDSEGSLFYADPPYMVTLEKPGYYQHEMTEEQHVLLRDMLMAIQGRFILSYDDHPRVWELYKGCNIQTTRAVHYSMNNRPGTSSVHKSEVFVTNF